MNNTRLKNLAGIESKNEKREKVDTLLDEVVRQIPAKDLVYEISSDLDDSHLKEILDNVQRKINAGYFDGDQN